MCFVPYRPPVPSKEVNAFLFAIKNNKDNLDGRNEDKMYVLLFSIDDSYKPRVCNAKCFNILLQRNEKLKETQKYHVWERQKSELSTCNVSGIA